MFIDPYDLRHALRDGTNITALGAVQLSAGTTSSARSDFTFSNSPSVTFGLDGAGVITASVAPAAGGLTNIKVSAGTLSQLRSDITFSNSNGVTFGLAAGVITATVATNYQPPGAYLTTAALSQDSSKYAGTGASSISTAGIDIVATAGTDGFSFGVPLFITTAMRSDNGSNFVQASATFFGTNASGTIASNAISVSVAAPSGGGAGTGFTTATTAGTDIVGTLDTNGLSMGVPAYLTTAATGGGLTAINVSAGTTSSNVSAITFSNGSGISFGFDGSNITATVATNYQSPGAYLTTAQPPGAYLTTAMASDQGSNFVQANATFFGTNASGTIASNAISVSVAAPSGGGAGTGFTTATTAGTAIVGTLQTNGLSMGVPAYLTAAAGGLSNINLSAGTTSTNASAFTFSNSNGVSFGMGTGANAGVITASISVSTVNLNTAIATLSFYENVWFGPNTFALQLRKSPGISTFLQVCPFVLNQAVSASFIRMLCSYQFQNGAVGTTANTSFSQEQYHTSAVVFMTQQTGTNSDILGYYTSGSGGWTFNTFVTENSTNNWSISYQATYPLSGVNNSTYNLSAAAISSNIILQAGSMASFAGVRVADIPFAASLSPGNYWAVLGQDVQVSGNGPAAMTGAVLATVTILGLSQANFGFSQPGLPSNNSNCMQPAQGSFSSAGLVMSTNSIDVHNISSQLANPIPYFQFRRSA